jgi:hypothetical protein
MNYRFLTEEELVKAEYKIRDPEEGETGRLIEYWNGMPFLLCGKHITTEFYEKVVEVDGNRMIDCREELLKANPKLTEDVENVDLLWYYLPEMFVHIVEDDVTITLTI